MKIAPSKTQPNTGVVCMEFGWPNDSRTPSKRDEIGPRLYARIPRICGDLATSDPLKLAH